MNQLGWICTGGLTWLPHMKTVQSHINQVKVAPVYEQARLRHLDDASAGFGFLHHFNGLIDLLQWESVGDLLG